MAALTFLLSLFLFVSPAAALLLDESSLRATLTLDKVKPTNDKLTLRGEFQLGPSSDGANPKTEDVVVIVGPFTQTIPANTFSERSTARTTTWTFKGVKGGLTRVVLTRTGQQWKVTATATGITLVGSTNPVPLSLRIGNDTGTLSPFFVVTENRTRVLFKFPAGNRQDADGDGFVPKPRRGEVADCDDQDPTIFPGAEELCNSMDDDCDTITDEAFPDLGTACTAGTGTCAQSGVKECAQDESGTVCTATPGTVTTEVCNGVDDDCDNQIDEGLGSTTCGQGLCQHTVESCVAGVPQVCDPFQGAQVEVCNNGLDEDCTGADLPCPPLAISITSPQNLALFNQSQQAVAGTVDPTVVAVSCNDQPMNLSAGSFSGTLTLHEGPTLITCVATDASGKVGTASITVTLDTMPPRITINTPSDGATLTIQPLTVSGLVNDIVVGTVGELQALVMCNGRSGQVANRAFVVTGVPLDPGANTITCTAQDRAENVDSARISVTLDTTATKQIAIVSSNTQTGSIGALLPQPLVVQLTENSAPAVGKVVLFKVLENDGVLSAGSNTGRVMAATTDANGRAQVNFTLGTWAGAGNNRVQALATGFVGEALFSLSALPGDANNIVVDAGNLQTGVVGQPLPKPFIVAVIDQGNNRLGGVPVTFTVVQGGGSFGGQSEMTVKTDSDGRAQAVLTLGPDEGFDNNMVNATFPSNPGAAAAFVASGQVAGDPEQTRISGVVLDNSNNPIAGVTLYIDGSPLTTQSNDQGQFVLQPAPVGHVKLVADGTTAAPRDGRPWPTLEYELVTIAGRDNTIGMPIFLLPIDTPNGLLVNQTTGGTLTRPEVPGFSLTIVPGSATFPDGSTSGIVSVTLVHADKVPMIPNFGQQPQFIVTIQPAGVHFNPPAAMAMPNVDGFAPGQKTEMYSFDHDLGQFVSIGPATVSDDGTVVTSDPGVGVVKGGWHCGGNPSPTGTCENDCTGPTLGQTGDTCPTCNDGNPCTEDKVVNGQCTHTNKPDGTDCREGNKCFKSAVCDAGVCGLVLDFNLNVKVGSTGSDDDLPTFRDLLLKCGKRDNIGNLCDPSIQVILGHDNGFVDEFDARTLDLDDFAFLASSKPCAWASDDCQHLAHILGERKEALTNPDCTSQPPNPSLCFQKSHLKGHAAENDYRMSVGKQGKLISDSNCAGFGWCARYDDNGDGFSDRREEWTCERNGPCTSQNLNTRIKSRRCVP